MNQDSFYILGMLILAYYLATLILVNRIVLFKGLKRVELDEDDIKSKLPYLISVNFSFLIANFILFDTLTNMVTYNLNDNASFMSMLSWSSIILIVNVCSITVSYLITLFVMKVGLKLINSVVFSIIWLCVNSVIIMLFNYLYIQISKTDAFTIF